MRRIVVSAGFALGLLGIPTALAQGYPTKAIRLITPYPPGGGIDASARIIGQALSEQLGQQVIIDSDKDRYGKMGEIDQGRKNPGGLREATRMSEHDKSIRNKSGIA